MPQPARRLATWDDLVRTPDDGHVYEVLDGNLVAAPRPAAAHGWAQSALAGEVHPPFGRGRGGPGGWWILIAPDVVLEPDQIVVPDIAGWKRERLPDPSAVRPIAVAPDWICEVVSPGDGGRDRVRKAAIYLRAGVTHYWILDPADRTLEAFEASAGRWLRLGAWTDGDTPRVAPFAAIEIEVAGFFLPRLP